MQFTRQQIVDKIVTSDVWMVRAFNKLVSDELVIDHDKPWFDAIKIKLDSGCEVPPTLKKIIRFKMISSYIDVILEFANGG